MFITLPHIHPLKTNEFMEQLQQGSGDYTQKARSDKWLLWIFFKNGKKFDYINIIH